MPMASFLSQGLGNNWLRLTNADRWVAIVLGMLMAAQCSLNTGLPWKALTRLLLVGSSDNFGLWTMLLVINWESFSSSQVLGNVLDNRLDNCPKYRLKGAHWIIFAHLKKCLKISGKLFTVYWQFAVPSLYYFVLYSEISLAGNQINDYTAGQRIGKHCTVGQNANLAGTN